MNEYRKQQLLAARLIEQGATAEQVAAVYGWIRGEPEQSAQTGYNQTLTEPRKCGIIKAIRRHVRRRKRKQEVKKMKNARAYFDKNGFIIGESAKFDFGKWHYWHERFTSLDAAETWLRTEEYDFRERELVSLTTARKHGYKE